MGQNKTFFKNQDSKSNLLISSFFRWQVSDKDRESDKGLKRQF